jgi:O-antigen/teichoic acid export membrane protein
MPKIDNIAKNTSYLTLALILQKIISFTYFTLLARYVGPASLGQYYLAISFTTIFSIVIDLGFANILTREIAKNKERAGVLLGNVLTLKLPLSILAVGVVVALVNWLPYDPLTKSLVYVSACSMVLDSFTSTFFAVIRGFHNLKYESISSIVYQIIVLVCGYSALLLGGGLLPAMLALAVASIYNFTYAWFVLKKHFHLPWRWRYDPAIIKEVLLISWPFAVYAIFQRLYTYLDSVLLSVLAGNAQVGLYQVAFKIIFALQFLPSAFTASLYPALSAYWQSDRKQLSISFERAINYLVIIVVPIIVGTVVLAEPIVWLFKAGYAEAVWPLRISIIALFFIFLNFPIGSLLNACDEQRKNTRNIAVVMILSVLMNWLLIPHWQALGASCTVLATNAVMFVLGLQTVRQLINYRWTNNLVIFAKTLLASLVMGAIIRLGSDYFHLIVTTLLGGGIYFLVLWGLRGFTRADVLSIIQSFRAKSGATINSVN